MGKLDLKLPILIGIIGGGMGIILTVGLLSGLVGRQNSKSDHFCFLSLIPIIKPHDKIGFF